MKEAARRRPGGRSLRRLILAVFVVFALAVTGRLVILYLFSRDSFVASYNVRLVAVERVPGRLHRAGEPAIDRRDAWRPAWQAGVVEDGEAKYYDPDFDPPFTGCRGCPAYPLFAEGAGPTPPDCWSFEDEHILVSWWVGPNGYRTTCLQLTNRGETDLAVDWSRAAIVGVDSRSQPIIHGGVRAADRDAVLEPTSVAPAESFATVVAPVSHVVKDFPRYWSQYGPGVVAVPYSESGAPQVMRLYYEPCGHPQPWITRGLLPDESHDRDRLAEEMDAVIGTTLLIRLPIRIGGTEFEYRYSFRVVDGQIERVGSSPL